MQGSWVNLCRNSWSVTWEDGVTQICFNAAHQAASPLYCDVCLDMNYQEMHAEIIAS